LLPGEVTDISVNLMTPAVAGIYEGSWVICIDYNEQLVLFGNLIYMNVIVKVEGISYF